MANPFNTFAVLLKASGLTGPEAGAFLKVNPHSIKNMAQGKAPAPVGVIDEMHKLVIRQGIAFEEMLEKIEAYEGELSDPDGSTITLDMAVDDVEAQACGFPTVSAMKVTIGMVAASLIQSGYAVVVEPSGSQGFHIKRLSDQHKK